MNNENLKNYGIILASGTGSRCNTNVPKQFIEFGNRTILEHTIDVFENTKEIDEIIVVITPEHRETAEKILSKNSFKKITKILNGGKERKDSSYIGINSIKEKEANVLIHDCARPFVTQEIISNCINALRMHEAVNVAIPSSDTIYEIENNYIKNIPKRKFLMRAQTPQCFRLSVIKKAHELSKNDDNFTDDSGLVVRHNLAKVFIVEGSTKNIKITYPSDLLIAEQLFKQNS